jgi:predicted phosphoribosyltransferase
MAQDQSEAGGRSGFEPDQVRIFRDRSTAGRHLARLLQHTREMNPIVLALPRGGVPVAFEIARDLGAPLDVFLVRKIGAPGHRELGIGAVAQGGVRILNQTAISMLDVSQQDIARIAAEETAELERRLHQYRGDRPLPDLNGRTVILVDDGLATGVSAMAAIRAIRRLHPLRIILAVPVCAPETVAALRPDVDDIVCALMPRNFVAVGYWYRAFDQITDAEVVDLLSRARQRPESSASDDAPVAGPLPSETNPI